MRSAEDTLNSSQTFVFAVTAKNETGFFRSSVKPCGNLGMLANL